MNTSKFLEFINSTSDEPVLINVAHIVAICPSGDNTTVECVGQRKFTVKSEYRHVASLVNDSPET